MSRVLVTGGAGFIGAEVVRHLHAAGRPVTVLDRLDGPRQRTTAAFLPDDVRVIRGDLVSLPLDEVLRDHDRIIHLAGTPGVQSSWADGFGDHLDGNLATTQRLLEAALRHGPTRVVLASSSSVYGDVVGTAREDDPAAPVSPYGATKAAMELLAGAYAARGVPITTLRYFTVHGRGQRPDMAVHRLLAAALGGSAFPQRGSGDQVRDLTAVDDVARATVLAADAPLPSGTVINVGGGHPISLRVLIGLVEEVVGAPVPIHCVPAAPGDPARTASDCRRAADLLGWHPLTSTIDAIADQLAHHPARGDARAA